MYALSTKGEYTIVQLPLPVGSPSPFPQPVGPRSVQLPLAPGMPSPASGATLYKPRPSMGVLETDAQGRPLVERKETKTGYEEVTYKYVANRKYPSVVKTFDVGGLQLKQTDTSYWTSKRGARASGIVETKYVDGVKAYETSYQNLLGTVRKTTYSVFGEKPASVRVSTKTPEKETASDRASTQALNLKWQSEAAYRQRSAVSETEYTRDFYNRQYAQEAARIESEYGIKAFGADPALFGMLAKASYRDQVVTYTKDLNTYANQQVEYAAGTQLLALQLEAGRKAGAWKTQDAGRNTIPNPGTTPGPLSSAVSWFQATETRTELAKMQAAFAIGGPVGLAFTKGGREIYAGITDWATDIFKGPIKEGVPAVLGSFATTAFQSWGLQPTIGGTRDVFTFETPTARQPITQVSIGKETIKNPSVQGLGTIGALGAFITVAPITTTFLTSAYGTVGTTIKFLEEPGFRTAGRIVPFALGVGESSYQGAQVAISGVGAYRTAMALPAEFRSEFYAKLAAARSIRGAEIPFTGTQYERIESLSGLRQTGKLSAFVNVFEATSSRLNVIQGGTTAIESFGGIKIPRRPQDIDLYAMNPSRTSDIYARELTKAGIEFKKEGTTIMFKNQKGEFVEALTFHSKQTVLLPTLKTVSGLNFFESNLYRIEGGRTFVDPTLVIARKGMASFDPMTTKQFTERVGSVMKERGIGKEEAKNVVDIETYFGKFYRYSKDAPAFVSAAKQTGEIAYAQAPQQVAPFSWLREYKYTYGLERLSPFFEQASGPRVVPTPNYPQPSFGWLSARVSAIESIGQGNVFSSIGKMFASTKASAALPTFSVSGGTSVPSYAKGVSDVVETKSVPSRYAYTYPTPSSYDSYGVPTISSGGYAVPVLPSSYPVVGTSPSYGVISIPKYPSVSVPQYPVLNDYKPSPIVRVPSYPVPSEKDFGVYVPSIPSMKYVPGPYPEPTPYPVNVPVPNYPFMVTVPSPPRVPPTYLRRSNQEQSRKKAFRVQIKRRGKFINVGSALPFGRALEFGSKKTRESLAATFRLKEAGTTDLPDTQYPVSTKFFRNYAVKQGQRVDLPLTFIQRRGTRLGTSAEVSEIGYERKSKRRTDQMMGGLFSV